eukprot:COSAG01_NODE_2425_length_7679_cov_96.031221_1_plen_241_part_00
MWRYGPPPYTPVIGRALRAARQCLTGNCTSSLTKNILQVAHRRMGARTELTRSCERISKPKQHHQGRPLLATTFHRAPHKAEAQYAPVPGRCVAPLIFIVSAPWPERCPPPPAAAAVCWTRSTPRRAPPWRVRRGPAPDGPAPPLETGWAHSRKPAWDGCPACARTPQSLRGGDDDARRRRLEAMMMRPSPSRRHASPQTIVRRTLRHRAGDDFVLDAARQVADAQRQRHREPVSLKMVG